MKTTLCKKCNKYITNNNFKRHYESCSNNENDKRINVDNKWLKQNGKYECPYCGKEYLKNGIATHIWRKHTQDGLNLNTNNKIPWNKGLTKDTDNRVKKNSENISNNMKGKKRNPTSIETKNKISKSMKKAHKEGRAWNIGKSRWNNKPSYPEEFFIKVIENEFNDKIYKREYNVGTYSIDFAWVHKKLAIEIDGDQHQRFTEYMERDKRKDKHLNENGWKVLRINWRDMCNNTKFYIDICKNFIDKNEINNEYNLELDYSFLNKMLKYKNDIPIQYLDEKEKEKIYNDFKHKIMNSNIDFSKLGWVNEVSKLTGLRTQRIGYWMKKYMPEFYEEKCFKRIRNN